MGTVGANIPTHLRNIHHKKESRFFIGTYTSSKKIRELYEYLPARDKQILHGICKSFSNKTLVKRILKRALSDLTFTSEEKSFYSSSTDLICDSPSNSGVFRCRYNPAVLNVQDEPQKNLE